MDLKQKIKNIINQLRTEKQVPIPKPINVQKVLEGKIALITGGSSGIGFALAQSFLDSGCKVIIAGTDEKKLKTCIEKLGSDVCDYIVLDVIDVKSIPEKIRLAAAKFAENRIDILVNSAGINKNTTFADVTETEYDQIMNVNLKGTYFMSQAVSQLMIEKEVKGHILNVSSSSALRPASTPYRISKWGIKGLTLGLAEKLLPYGIVVNAIAPGPVSTPMIGRNEGDTIEKPDVVYGRCYEKSKLYN